MRIVILLLLLACMFLGVVFGALNTGMVPFDFGFVRVALPKGGALLAALVFGWLLGGITAWWGTRGRSAGTPRRRPRGGPKDNGHA